MPSLRRLELVLGLNSLTIPTAHRQQGPADSLSAWTVLFAISFSFIEWLSRISSCGTTSEVHLPLASFSLCATPIVMEIKRI